MTEADRIYARLVCAVWLAGFTLACERADAWWAGAISASTYRI